MILDCKRVVTASIFMAQVFSFSFHSDRHGILLLSSFMQSHGQNVLHGVSQGPKSYPDG